MAHLFKQMYLEGIADIKKQLTSGLLTTAITVELIKRQNDELKRKKKFPSLLQRLTNYLVDGTTLTKRENKLDKNKCGN